MDKFDTVFVAFTISETVIVTIFFIFTTEISVSKMEGWKILREVMNININWRKSWCRHVVQLAPHIVYVIIIFVETPLKFFDSALVAASWIGMHIPHYLQFVTLSFVLDILVHTENQFVSVRKNLEISIYGSTPCYIEEHPFCVEIRKIKKKYLKQYFVLEQLNIIFGWPLAIFVTQFLLYFLSSVKFVFFENMSHSEHDSNLYMFTWILQFCLYVVSKNIFIKFSQV